MKFGLCLACGREGVLLTENGWQCLDCHDQDVEERQLKKWADTMTRETGILLIPSLKDFRGASG